MACWSRGLSDVYKIYDGDYFTMSTFQLFKGYCIYMIHILLNYCDALQWFQWLQWGVTFSQVVWLIGS